MAGQLALRALTVEQACRTHICRLPLRCLSEPPTAAACCPQEYYEVLHSCLAVVPAFANDAYYINKVRPGQPVCRAVHAGRCMPLDFSGRHTSWVVLLPPQHHSGAAGCAACAAATSAHFPLNANRPPQGSSSIGASLISGVPLISHRYMLKSYK